MDFCSVVVAEERRTVKALRLLTTSATTPDSCHIFQHLLSENYNQITMRLRSYLPKETDVPISRAHAWDSDSTLE